MTAVTNEQFRFNARVTKGGTGEISTVVYGFNLQETVIINKTTDSNGDVTTTNIEARQLDDDGTQVITTRTPVKIRALKWGNFVEEQAPVISVGASAAFALETNNILTQTNQGTVNGYTGITINAVPAIPVVTLDGSGGDPLNNVDRLYDRLQSYVVTAGSPPLYDFPELLDSVDKSNYRCFADIIISGFAFLGQSRSFNMQGAADVTVQGSGGDLDNLSITGNLNVGNVTGGQTFTNVNVSGTLTFTQNGTYNWDGGSLNNVDLGGGATAVTLNLSNGAQATGTIDPGITIVQAVPIFVKCQTDAGVGIPGVNVRLGTTVGGIDVVDNVLTDSNGEINGTFTGSTPATASGFAAKGTEKPTFVRAPLGGPINAGTGYSQIITMTSDD